jgi:hypothetical protein
VNSFKASALSARKHYYGALSQSSSDVPFIPSRLRLTLASGILTDNHVAQDCLPSTPGGSTPTHCCLSGFVVHSTFYCFRLIHQQNPPATSGIPTDHETRRHHADNLRHPLSLDCRFGIWLAWHSRGKLLYFLQGLYPAVAPIVWSIHSRLIPYQPETCRRNE